MKLISENKFNHLVRTNEVIFKSKNKSILNFLELRKLKVAKENEGLIESIESPNRHICLTCGVIGKSHPVTSYCFICDTDNWHELRYLEMIKLLLT